jgi:prepilin signal peptidase PulO-like enzyme (type II secretory pathway)
MESLRYLVTALCAWAVAAALQGWLLRQPAERGGEPPHDSSPPASPVPPAPSPALSALALHGAVLTVLALGLAWIDRASPAFGLSQSLLLLFLLYPLAVLDWVTMEVDLRLVLLGLLLRLGGVALWNRTHTPEAVLGMLAGAGMITLAALAYRALRGRAGLGEGDAGVLALAGGFVGWGGLLPTLLIAASAGAVVGLAVLLLQRRPLDTPIPFVPFLCAAALTVHVAQRVGWTGFPLG